ncbi:DUF202 domain-containing protein [Streptomyces sp. JJ38]|nr:DUF202 domain-containing protein [Streptomyces sp. JJ38]
MVGGQPTAGNRPRQPQIEPCATEPVRSVPGCGSSAGRAVNLRAAGAGWRAPGPCPAGPVSGSRCPAYGERSGRRGYAPGVIGRLGNAVRLWFSPSRVRAEGHTPDYRFSLANERTFLAWIRTALALVAGGVAVDQFLTRLGSATRTGTAVVLMVGGAVCAVRAVHHWVRCELAMRRGEDLPPSRFPALLGVGIALAAVMVAGALVLDGGGR